VNVGPIDHEPVAMSRRIVSVLFADGSFAKPPTM
jgi:hypothetical protein